jgi:Protein of unknown function (DUF1064)
MRKKERIHTGSVNIDTTKPISVEQFKDMLKNKAMPNEKRKTKFGAIKCEIDGLTFASKAEGKRYKDLMLLYKAKKISKPILQYEFELNAGIKYRCDFLYICLETRKFTVEDVKGFKTTEYKLKKKLMKKVYGIEILETN